MAVSCTNQGLTLPEQPKNSSITLWNSKDSALSRFWIIVTNSFIFLKKCAPFLFCLRQGFFRADAGFVTGLFKLCVYFLSYYLLASASLDRFKAIIMCSKCSHKYFYLFAVPAFAACGEVSFSTGSQTLRLRWSWTFWSYRRCILLEISWTWRRSWPVNCSIVRRVKKGALWKATWKLGISLVPSSWRFWLNKNPLYKSCWLPWGLEMKSNTKKMYYRYGAPNVQKLFCIIMSKLYKNCINN